MKAISKPEPINLRLIKRPNKRQRKFIELWLDTESDTFGNAYQSAIKAGFSEKSARVITGNSRNLDWVQDAKQLYASLEPEHIYLAMQQIATNTRADRDKLRALELMAKIRGMFIERTQSDVNVKFTNSVPRPVIELSGTDAGVGSITAADSEPST